MKLRVCLLLILSMVFAACGNYVDEPKGPAPSANSAPIDPKSLVDAKSETFLALDEIAGQMPKPGVPITVNTASFGVRGWAVDQRAKTVAGGVIISVDGKDFVADYGSPRPDVAANLKNSDYINSGFTVSIDSSAIGKGKHTLIFRVVTSDRKSYYQQKQGHEVVVE
jgi:hypothetical protein